MIQIAQLEAPSNLKKAPPDPARSARVPHLFGDALTGDIQCPAALEVDAAHPPRARVGRPFWRRAGAIMGNRDTWGWTIASGLAPYAELKVRVEQADRVTRRDAYALGRVERALARELGCLMALGSRFALDTIDELTEVRMLSGDVVPDTEQCAARQAAIATFRENEPTPRPTITSPLAQLTLRQMRRDLTIIHDILERPASSRSSAGIRELDSIRARFWTMDGDTERDIVDSFDWSIGEAGWFRTFVARAVLDLRVLEQQYRASRAASCCGCG